MSTVMPLDFEALFGATTSPYLVLDRALTIVEVNDAYLRGTGMTRDSVLGRHVFDAYPAGSSDSDVANIAKLRSSFERVLEQRTAEQIDFLRYDIPTAADGTGPFERRYWSPINTPLMDERGDVTHILHNAIDITSRVISEDALVESERRYRALINATGDVIYRMSPDWKYMDVLDGRGFLKTTDSLAEYRIEDYVPTEELDLVSDAIAAAIRDKSIFALEHRVLRADDSNGWTFSQAVPILAEDGSVREWVGSASDITARKIAEERLKDSNRRKDEFLAMLAHELRNPLAPISTAASLLQLSCRDDARVLKASGIIQRQVEHLTNLVDDLLDVSRVTRGLVDLEKFPVVIRDIVADAVEQTSPLMQARRHNLTVRLRPDTLTVLGDRKRLIQVLSNLLNNAAKYTPDGGDILVEAQVDDGHVVFQVIDNGLGMSAVLVSQAFELFTQAERNSDRSTGGLGLGLALVKNLVELHGGTVACESAGLGTGSTFTVRLPLLATEKNFTDDLKMLAQYPGSFSLRIMIVDDNVDAAETLGMMLGELGHEIAVAHDPCLAIDRAETESFDVFILDIGLPDMDGHELAHQLRNQRGEKSVFIAVTGYGQDDDKARSRAAGFSHHLVKPVNMHELTEALATVKAS